MHGNNFTRSLRLVKHLITHPIDILPYLSQGPLCKKTPFELGVPWFSSSAIRFLNKFTKPDMRVFEYGAGGSTVFFATKGAEVVSTEDHAQWYEKIKAEFEKQGLQGITLTLHSYDFKNPDSFKNSDYLNSIPAEEDFDIFLIDGTEHETKVRPACFLKAQEQVKTGSIIIVDDSWRYPEIVEASTAKEVRRFQGTGPCRPGVTSTDIHFY